MEIAFALDTFYAVMAGALVMFMAAGFTMLEAGLVQKKDCLLYTSDAADDTP